MNKTINILIYFLFIAIPVAKCSVPGTFFWKPRLGLDLGVPTTEYTVQIALRNKENIRKGLVVLVDGYSAGLTVISVAAGLSNSRTMSSLNPISAFFYTNVYRWALRYISLVPVWMGGHGSNFCETTRLWKRRYYYMDEMVPSWLRTALFYVRKEEWEKEDLDQKRFKKYSEPAFGKHYRNVNKVFNNFKSYLTVETESLSKSSSHIL